MATETTTPVEIPQAPGASNPDRMRYCRSVGCGSGLTLGDASLV